jgi:hypothetical protein
MYLRSNPNMKWELKDLMDLLLNVSNKYVYIVFVTWSIWSYYLWKMFTGLFAEFKLLLKIAEVHRLSLLDNNQLMVKYPSTLFRS